MISEMVAQKIKKARRDAGMSQKELGRILKVGQTTISGYENHTSQPDFNSLAQIAKAAGKPLSWFFEEEPRQGFPLRNQPAPALPVDLRDPRTPHSEPMPDSGHTMAGLADLIKQQIALTERQNEILMEVKIEFSEIKQSLRETAVYAAENNRLASESGKLARMNLMFETGEISAEEISTHLDALQRR